MTAHLTDRSADHAADPAATFDEHDDPRALVKGFRAEILRGPFTTSRLDALSTQHRQVTITGVVAGTDDHDAREAAERGRHSMARRSTATADAPAVILVVRRLCASTQGYAPGLYIHAEPSALHHPSVLVSDSGAFVSGGGFQFGELLRDIYGDHRYQVGPIPLHDRHEPPA